MLLPVFCYVNYALKSLLNIWKSEFNQLLDSFITWRLLWKKGLSQGQQIEAKYNELFL